MDPQGIPPLEAQLSRTRWLGIHFHPEVASTQDAALVGPPGCRIHWADRQTAGRGRQGRRWSDGGKDLAVTFRVEGWRAAHPELLALAVPVAVAAAAEALLPQQLWCKWPNDVLAGAANPAGGPGLAKLAGVLIDGSGPTGPSGRTPIWRIGVGLNVNRQAFPADLDQPATSMAHLVGRDLDRGALLVGLAKELDRRLDEAAQEEPEALLAAYRARLHGMGRVVQVERGSAALKTGRLVGLHTGGLALAGMAPIPLAHITRIIV